MSLRHLKKPHLDLILHYTLRHAVRGGAGLVYLLLAVAFGLVTSSILLNPVEAAIAERKKESNKVEDRQVVAQMVEFARTPVEWLISGRSSGDPEEQAAVEERAREWARFLLDEKPAILSAIFLILIFGMPFIVPFGGFNQTAGDIGNRGLRYQLLRTERINIFFGRFLGISAFTILVQAFTMLTVTLYIMFKIKIYDAADVALWSLQGFAALVFLSIPYVALCAWISASNDSAMVSLMFCKITIGVILLLAYYGGNRLEQLSYAQYLLPWGVSRQLLAPELSRAGLAAAACLGYTLVYLWFGQRTFEKRDL